MAKTVHVLEKGASRFELVEDWHEVPFQLLVDIHEIAGEMTNEERDEWGESDEYENLFCDHYFLHDTFNNYFIPGEEYSFGKVIEALSKNEGYCVECEEVNICFGRTKVIAAAADVIAAYGDEDDWDE